MRLLALDCSTDRCSVALLDDGRLLEREEPAGRAQAERAATLVEAVLGEAGLRPTALDALAFGRGPGSFTGVRVATGLVQGLALGAGLPVVPVSSLAALASGAWRAAGVTEDAGAAAPLVLAALDARMGECYWALYARGAGDSVESLGREAVTPPEALCLPSPEAVGGRAVLAAGNAWESYPEALARALPGVTPPVPARGPKASELARLAVAALVRGEAVDCARAIPVYVRDRVTHGA